jgi:hypothetical protein
VEDPAEPPAGPTARASERERERVTGTTTGTVVRLFLWLSVSVPPLKPFFLFPVLSLFLFLVI